MTNAPMLATLRRIFDVVVSEAERNPAFAAKLALAVTRDVAAPRARKPATRKHFDASQFHAINILRMHGEPALRGKLEQVRAVEDLRTVARMSGLVLSGAASKAQPSRADLIEGIVDAARHYDAQRNAATA
jgi:hypothetical protein